MLAPLRRGFYSWLDFLAKQTRPPEHSRALRLAVATNVGIGVLSTGYSLDWPWFVYMGFPTTLAAMVLSYRWRTRNNWDIKAILSIGMVLSLVRFFWSILFGNVTDPRVPLAELLVWLQTLHSFDLPGRRDLNYSLLVALILISIAAVTSTSFGFGIFLGLYSLAFFWASGLQYQRMLEERGPLTKGVMSRDASMGVSATARPPWFGLILGSVLVFFIFPRFQAFRIRALPFSLPGRLNMPSFSRGKVQNPAFPSASTPEEFRKKAKWNPDSYAGLNPIVDLQLRGAMNSDLALRVRSTHPSYLRGVVFDQYDGQFWTKSAQKPKTLQADSPPFYLESEFRPTMGRRPCGAPPPKKPAPKLPRINAANFTKENVQIVYAERAMPNIILAAYEPQTLYYPSVELYRESNAALVSPYPMEAGMVYSVISREPQEVPEILRALPEDDPLIEKNLQQYLQLPQAYSQSGTPENELQQLALKLTQARSNPYLKTVALVHFLHRNFPYRLDVEAYPEGKDIAAHFVLVKKQGYCEQFATALAVMARSVGLPSRYVTGFLPGTYNPFTGYHEVCNSDAHAWTEIYIPNYGWLPFDGTPPGQQFQQNAAKGPSTSMLDLMLDYFDRNPLPGSAWLIPLAAVFLLGGPRLWERLQAQKVSTIVRALSMCEPICGAKPSWMTLRQYAANCQLESFHRLVEIHEQAVYQGAPTSSDLEAESALGQLSKELAQRRQNSSRTDTSQSKS